jgi:tetratricopeptide (TPR) repeat protein
VDDLIIARLRGGEMLPYTVARNATDGMAEVFFTLAVALNGEAEDGYTLLYARIASWLRPDHSEAILLSAALLEQQQQYDLAVATYAQVAARQWRLFCRRDRPRPRPAGRRQGRHRDRGAARPDPQPRRHACRCTWRWAMRCGAGRTLGRGGRKPMTPRWRASANPNGGTGRCSTAAPSSTNARSAWDQGRARFPARRWTWNPTSRRCSTISAIPTSRWAMKLEEALAMIERAVAGTARRGYIIIDSLAWGLFRLGRYEEAVEPMERASVLEPVDPIVTDHLGDVYWAVGRDPRGAVPVAPRPVLQPRGRRSQPASAASWRWGWMQVLAEEGAKPLRELPPDR